MLGKEVLPTSFALSTFFESNGMMLDNVLDIQNMVLGRQKKFFTAT